jgi:hypothetical protein
MADDRDRPMDQKTGEATGTPAPGETSTTGTGTATDPGRPYAFPMPPPVADAGSGAEAKARTGAGFLTSARKRTAGILAAAVSVITTVVVATLAVHIVFVAFEANTANELVSTVADWAEGMAWQFTDVFQPADPKIEVAANYGLAAVAYLVAGRIAIGLIRRLA